ncbi:MAG TPA: hypothetical protein VN088_12555 [Nocardioides sp.]|nr:hypothetical protein [Nocardioides sp.]
MSRLFDGLLDDAALFPPAELAMQDAVVAHLAHRSSAYDALLGTFVVAAQDLDALAAEVAGLPPRSMRISVTLPMGSLCQVVEATDRIEAVRLGAVEAVPPPGRSADMVVGQLRSLLAERPVMAYVEVPRDERRDDYIAALAGTTMRAKLRTGGVVAELHPSCEELAGSVVALVRAGVPFKATAGLHHAIRNTDPVTGFDQHGFLNLMVATDAAMHDAELPAVADLLAERDTAKVVRRARLLDPQVRTSFLSFGTCSVAEPVEELVALGFLPADHRVIQAALR